MTCVPPPLPRPTGANRKQVAHAATRALGLKYPTFYEFGKITLCRGGTRVSEVRVLLVGHAADKPLRAGVEQRIEHLALALAARPP